MHGLKEAMHARLMDAGGWMSRAALADGVSTSPPAIEDALADLVLEKKAEYRDAVGYRLAGTDLTRSAVKQMRADALSRMVCGRQVKDEYRVGVAQAHARLGAVMFEMTLPMPAPGPEFLARHQAQINAIIEFAKGER